MQKTDKIYTRNEKNTENNRVNSKKNVKVTRIVLKPLTDTFIEENRSKIVS